MQRALALSLICWTLVGRADELGGHWKGNCRSFPPLPTSTLSVELTIGPEGAVSGKVGDAVIAGGRIRPRSVVELELFNHFEYRIDFQLAGPLSITNDVSRASGRINLTRSNGDLHGWFVSSGSPFGPPSRIQITTRNLVLRRVK
jgi:hypothetical protein